MTLTIQDIGGGGSRFEGFERIIHLGAGTVLLTGVALSIASVVAFFTSSAWVDRGPAITGRCARASTSRWSAQSCAS
jgi:hypothetical protein